MSAPAYEIFAIRFATMHRRRRDNFIHPVTDEPDKPTELDFYVWLIVGNGKVVLVDTGFSHASSLARGRPYLIEPASALRDLGYPPESVQDVIVTHLHYDHAGNVGDYGHARIWLQERELQYATGKCMCEPRLNYFFATDDIAVLLKRLYRGDVRLIQGSYSLHDGIELHAIGGHTDGLQVVRVRTSRGWIVLASDAAHYYENYQTRNPFPALYKIDELLAGYSRIERLADGPEFIIPGHDPLVGERYPSTGLPTPYAHRIA
ncbi:glyoxylase-like metal-dependent hydrolase (beta-lactamase superfamily II) [Trinickia symbiotica]|uniref:N-acyl homoserine lactonase family protein n=1 Tax=Trinickia symbiotica TaxID=863227 RepID=A0A2N7WLI4_9BURK|nr:N-acyl homoserine lactonase family protein [Trinickia symbiotica]PMS30155.1 N-acyl homoserine lactonase family protein [Trinickia symbiotica]PPK41182.1 glyoxylase-like metal-dependent hydrolase (beta-lactamase superfamily II) [Trinickia symbiotica]